MAKVGRLVKEAMLKELGDQLIQQPNFFLTSVERLQAVEADALRKQLRTAKGHLFVVKQRLGLRGLTGLAKGNLNALLIGSVGFVLSSEDVLPVAKILVSFAKTNEGRLLIRGGWVDGQLLDHKRVEELASLLPRPQLIAQLIGLIESPLASVVQAVEGLLRELAWILEEVGKKVPAPQSQPAAEAQPTPPATQPSRPPDTIPPAQEAGQPEPPAPSQEVP